jgi:hypothetical protein
LKDADAVLLVASLRNLLLQGVILTENRPSMKYFKPTFKKQFISLLVLAFFSAWIPLMAQDVDHVYLKTGSIVRGKIIEIALEDHVKIEDLSGNVWNFNISEVEKITSEPYAAGKKINSEPIGFEPGFVNMTSIGFLAGSANNEQAAPFSLLMVNGYRTSQGLYAGIGTGIEFLSTNYMPFFLDLRYDLFGEDVVPYVMAKGGYSVPLGSENTSYDVNYTYSGGPLLGVGVGLKIKTRRHFAWDVSLLYRYQETSYKEDYSWNNQEYEYTDVFNRIELRLGFYID